MSQILVAEDENIVAMDIQEALKSAHYGVSGVVDTGRDAVRCAAETKPDLVLMDIRLKGDMDGIQAASRIRESLDVPIIYLTAYSDDKTLERAKSAEPYGYLLKPFEKAELHSAIEMALHKHKMEKELKENRRWLSSILGSAGDAVVATDAQGRVTFMNPVAEALTGWKLDELRGKMWMEGVQIREGAAGDEALRREFIEGRAGELSPRSTLVSRDGAVRPVDGTLAPIRDEKGRLTGVVLAFRDVSARRRLEETLQRSNEDLEKRVRERTDSLARLNEDLRRHVREIQALYDYAPCGYHSLNAKGVITRINRTALNWLGRRSTEVVGKMKFADFIAPESRALFDENFAIFSRRGWLRDVEYEMLARGGATFPALLSVSAVKEADGRYVMARAAVHNLAERRRAEREIRETETKFQSLAETALDGVVVADEGGRILYANKSTLALFGYAEKELLGASVALLIPERCREAFKAAARGLAEPGGARRTMEIDGRDKTGREFPMELSLSTWLSGGTRFYAGFLRDVTERKRLQGMLLHSERLVAMGQMAAGIAHELKTPLGVIFGFADVMEMKVSGSPELQEMLETLKRQVMRCSRLVDNLLGFSRQRRGGAQEEAVDLNEVVVAALALVSPHASAKSVEIRKELDGGPLRVKGVKEMLEQIIINLALNGVDAMSPGGALTLSVRRVQRDGGGYIRLRVADTGPGVPPEVRERLFQPFFTTKEKGNGLGLWIVREIATGFGGSIQCESAPGQGAVFLVDFPEAVPSEGRP